MTARPRHIHYLEGRGEAARRALLHRLAELRRQTGLLDAYLLAAPEQPGLWLLESRWSGRLPDLPCPPDCRSWAFEVQEEPAEERP